MDPFHYLTDPHSIEVHAIGEVKTSSFESEFNLTEATHSIHFCFFSAGGSVVADLDSKNLDDQFADCATWERFRHV